MDDHQERQFVEGLRAGKTEAWQALYDAYALRVWQSVARLMGSDESGVVTTKRGWEVRPGWHASR